jgi:beta-aspartyl-peptidase (threonine type)
VFNVAGKARAPLLFPTQDAQLTPVQNELETSLMLSKPPASHPHIPASRRGTALTLLTRARNPSQLVRALYLAPERAEHPFLSGAAAEELGATLGAELVDPSYFFTEARWREHRAGLGLPAEPLPPHLAPDEDHDMPLLDLMPTGTVGCVARDARGALCAVTSTGGRTNKLVGRVGDTPHMGAGFWAAEWAVRGRVRRAWRAATGRPTSHGVAISGTGDGDVRAC